MKKNNYNNFIKNYDTIRFVLRNIFLYGCLTKDTFMKLNISGRKYDNESRRIKIFIDQEFIDFTNQDRKKALNLYYDLFNCPDNYLVDTYLTKSFSENDAYLYFKIYELLSMSSDGLSTTTIIDAIAEEIDSLTIRRKLSSMADEGYLQQHTVKNKQYYMIKSNPLDHLSIQEIIALYNAINFFSHKELIAVPGYYLLTTLKEYLQWNRNYTLQDSDYVNILTKHHHINLIIDNDIVYKISYAINHKMLLDFKYDDLTFKAIPQKIITDDYNGRSYVYGLTTDTLKSGLFRIDKMYSLNIIKDPAPKPYNNNYEKDLSYSWCTSMPMNSTTKVLVSATFYIDEKNEGFILQRINREGKWGSLTKQDTNLFLYEIQVTDPNEMIPWFRSFGERVRIHKSQHHQLYEKLAEDWRLALEKYNTL